MKTLTTVLFASDIAKRISLISTLRTLGIVKLHVYNSDYNIPTPFPLLNDLDIVVCDSFSNLEEFKKFTSLLNRFDFFTVIESEKLNKALKWGIKKLLINSKKYHGGYYRDAIAEPQMFSLLNKTATLKKIQQHNNTDHKYWTTETPQYISTQNIPDSENQDADNLVVLYRPRFNLSTNKICGMRALPFHINSDKELILLSDDSKPHDGANSNLNAFIKTFNQGIQLHRHVRNMGETLSFTYTINPASLQEKDFSANLIKQIHHSGVPFNEIILEITGAGELHIDTQTINNITTLTYYNVQLSLCDFGICSTSIQILSELPFSSLKVTPYLTKRLHHSTHYNIMKFLVSMASTLNVKLIADGVKTEQQRTNLQCLGVDIAEGDFYHKPMHADRVLSLILEIQSINQ